MNTFSYFYASSSEGFRMSPKACFEKYSKTFYKNKQANLPRNCRQFVFQKFKI